MGQEGTTPIVPWYYDYNVVLIEFVTLCPKTVLLYVVVVARRQQTLETRIDVRDTKGRRSGMPKIAVGRGEVFVTTTIIPKTS